MSGLAFALLLTLQVPPSSPPATVVRTFYGEIVKHHPLGIPEAELRNILWPLLSARVRRQLEVGAACEEDYYRQHRRLPNADQLKPEIPWLEEGLFSGENEMALPAEVQIGSVEPLKPGHYRVQLGFTYRDSFETYGRPPDDSNTFSWLGSVHVISEHGQYVIDEFVLQDGKGKPLPSPLEFLGCKGTRWVGF